MNCGPLPGTGLDAHPGVLLLVAIACLLVGAMIVLASRARAKRRAQMTAGPGSGASSPGAAVVLLMILVVGGAVAIGPAPPAQAAGSAGSASSGCVAADDFLTVIQTSTMAGLAPGVAPVPIAGLVVNNSADSTHIVAVEVEISSVAVAPGSPVGSCDASDYVLLDTRMPVDRTLGPGASASFAGASIGFSDSAVDQDACQRATIHLLYTANPR
ncbi:hypothetical protein [Compostimonas suwonensis]|uniref:Uncharacterized protein n=1 Tax=Compostimonas suwonensis TaxID=1048394 RepID=A0A2M9BVS6_9MICO|nr:hypothetical protein [Compostimonas suwonensis]PJJ62058.1 hypothetical protein CLV54_1851 [Compostimonas suwonensis]